MMDSKPENISPVNRPLSQAAAYYSRLAPYYDVLAGSEKKFIHQGLSLLNPQPGEWILEIGFGTGFAQQHLIPAVGNGLSVGSDLSMGMARMSSRKMHKAGLGGQTNLVCSDSLPLPFPANLFDAIFTSFTLELFDTPQIPIFLDECRRVLKPGKRLVVVSLSKDQPMGFMGRLYESFHNRFPTIADCRPIPVRHLLEKNGFIVTDIATRKMWGLPVNIAVAHS
jgi:demethylmenaquinone methyltransferase/2-methoxy-6-polyprenyl-1,4-benzoquinol methylase